MSYRQGKTAITGLLYEPEATSEKSCVKQGGNVRILELLRTKQEGRAAEMSEPGTNFRQKKKEAPRKCLNLGLLRTKQRRRAAEMSEPGTTSDKTRAKHCGNV
ncbi:hypothetical protein [Mesobacillus sp.]|uniref:hypothetical protein n=1 Tax=Mesobacillus sp. TaxID=2675271 RepID=UPI0039EFA6E3